MLWVTGLMHIVRCSGWALVSSDHNFSCQSLSINSHMDRPSWLLIVPLPRDEQSPTDKRLKKKQGRWEYLGLIRDSSRTGLLGIQENLQFSEDLLHDSPSLWLHDVQLHAAQSHVLMVIIKLLNLQPVEQLVFLQGEFVCEDGSLM